MEYWETLLSHELGPRHEFEGLAKGGPERPREPISLVITWASVFNCQPMILALKPYHKDAGCRGSK